MIDTVISLLPHARSFFLTPLDVTPGGQLASPFTWRTTDVWSFCKPLLSERHKLGWKKWPPILRNR